MTIVPLYTDYTNSKVRETYLKLRLTGESNFKLQNSSFVEKLSEEPQSKHSTGLSVELKRKLCIFEYNSQQDMSVFSIHCIVTNKIFSIQTIKRIM